MENNTSTHANGMRREASQSLWVHNVVYLSGGILKSIVDMGWPDEIGLAGCKASVSKDNQWVQSTQL
jgi:hypothetical protein